MQRRHTHSLSLSLSLTHTHTHSQKRFSKETGGNVLTAPPVRETVLKTFRVAACRRSQRVAPLSEARRPRFFPATHHRFTSSGQTESTWPNKRHNKPLFVQLSSPHRKTGENNATTFLIRLGCSETNRKAEGGPRAILGIPGIAVFSAIFFPRHRS